MVPSIYCILFAGVFYACSTLAQDIPLNRVLIKDEGWEKVVGGMKFCDACCSDRLGNFYFSDAKGGDTVMKVTPSGEVSDYINGVPGISGMQFGPGGKLYACQGRSRRIVALSPGKIPELIVAEIRPNDLVVTKDGHLYFTETSTRRVYHLDLNKAGKRLRIVASDIAKPNGIALTTDGGTLLVSDHMDKEVWVFRIEKDGSLGHRAPYACLRLRSKNHPSKGDGIEVDDQGCFYVASDLGLQMFDPTGRISGVILSPQPGKPLVSVVFSGKRLEYLYIANGDAVFRRKIQSKGVLHW
ncbi:MAG: SMP-30/gluconolactonase/LRE family protein [Verrucomicrobiaceae bacterium]|nr:SMP-30/gluconolactonase/LRE family protein [Verrucomicrobiaceae bacterium]